MHIAMFLLRFLKNWTLPCALVAGLIGYLLLHGIEALAPLRPAAHATADALTPTLIFLMLFFTFCKVDLSRLRPRMWHVWMIVVQTVLCGLTAWVAMKLPAGSGWKTLVEGLLACIICPTATAAAVITGRLGGSAASITTYTLASNLVSAVLIALLCPLVEPHADLRFGVMLTRMLPQVFELLLLPFIVAQLLRVTWPWLHRQCLRIRGVSFYLWAMALVIVSAQTASVVNAEGSHPLIEAGLTVVGLAICAVQFALGRWLGARSGDRISGGQALGQKNTVFAIWMAFAYLTPLAAIGPGSYVMWQNVVNAYQLWRFRRREEQGLGNPRDRSAADDE